MGAIMATPASEAFKQPKHDGAGEGQTRTFHLTRI